MSVIIGVDPHKASNTIAVLDGDEVLFDHRYQNTTAGFGDMLAAVAVWPQRRWAVEGAHGMGHLIAQQLLGRGESVVDVPAKLATRVRVYSTGHGRKTDRDDAISIARAAVHARSLRLVTTGDELDALKLLTEHRRELVVARTRAACRLHRLLRELIPGGAPLELNADHAAKLLAKVHPSDPASVMRRQIAKDHIADIRRLDRRLDTAGEQLECAVTATGTTVTALHGVGRINAATILAETGDITRFPTRNHYASYAGTAPLDASSGDVERHRVNPAGNRRLNWAIHIAAIVQIRHDCPGRAYYQRKLAAGKDRRAALRCLKRRITDAVYRQLRADAGLSPEPEPTWPRTAPAIRRTYRSTHTPRHAPARNS
jgi:transposase